MRIEYAPHEYQKVMLDHMIEHPRAAVFAGMGMGKTSSALTLIDALNVVEGTRPTLVLAPLRVAKSTWPREAAKWRHLENINVSPVVGSAAERLRALKQDANVFAINYDNLPWLIEHFAALKRWPFRRVVADESTRLKNFRLRSGGKRSAQLARVAHLDGLDRWINLTGTPAPNGLKDLWGQMWFLDRGQRLGRTYTAFTERWFQRAFDGYGVDPLPSAQVQIQEAIRDITLSLDPRDWFDLEEPIVKNIYIDLPEHARRRYREMERTMFTELNQKTVEVFNAAAKSAKCLQIASGTAWISTAEREWAAVHDEKLDALESIVEEANGMPVMIAYHWVPSRERILQRFPKFRYFDARAQTEDDWNAGKIPGLVIHGASGGHGLNLQTGGNIIAHYDQWWDLELYQQVNERIGPVRQKQSGLDRNVWHYHILARDTLDEDVMVRRETKREVQDVLMDAMKRRQQ